MLRFTRYVMAFGLLFMPVYHAQSQELMPERPLSYADIADLTLAAPIVALARIDRVRRVDEDRATGLRPNHVRYYIESDLDGLIRSAQAVPARVSYLLDMPLDADGRRPRIRDRRVIILATAVPGRRGELQLIAPDAQIDWTEDREQTIRTLLSNAASNDAPGTITGVGNAFSVPGTLPGESETQIFLATSDGRPVSISVLRRPNQEPRWSVSMSEIVERASPPPASNTLLWYRLACFLPNRLPESSMETTDRNQAAIARQDYGLVIDDLGPCPRYRR